MPRYFLHVVNRIGLAPDEEGAELENLDAALERAREGVRSILSDEAKRGRLDLDGRVEIVDETGHVHATLPFPDAFEIVMPASRAYRED